MGGIELKGAVAVVTGASAGIGRATATALARKGAIVVASARRVERLEELAGQIERQGGRSLPVKCDVSDPESVRALRKRVVEELGRCDVLVNNAGIPGGGRFNDLPLDQVVGIIGTNLMGVVYCTKEFLPMMLAAGKGHVVNVASLAGRFATPGSAVYAATKHAVVAFSESLHYEVAHQGVLVTTVNPGFVTTEGFPHRDSAREGGNLKRLMRVMQPERVASVIVDVVEGGRGPEVSVPRWLSAFQAVRVLAPPVYHYVLERAARAGVRPTQAR